jgi:hypothetical protein
MYEFNLLDIILHPEAYRIWEVDMILLGWLAQVKAFIVANPITAVGIAWAFGWFVKRTPWSWDDKLWEWIKEKIGGLKK